MKHRIRAAAIVIHNAKILLVKHQTLATGAEWWIPPGGGVEPEDATIMTCAQRETWEETGLRVTCDRIAYIREFVQPEYDMRHMEFFLVADLIRQNPETEITLAHLPDPLSHGHQVIGVEWVSRSALLDLVVYPAILKSDEFWDDSAQGFPQVKYLLPTTD
jgi:8-oxo-dGTP diphosphatase